MPDHPTTPPWPTDRDAPADPNTVTRTAARWIHDMATPLLTLQLNAQALSERLPLLLHSCGPQVPGLSATQLQHLALLPAIMANEIDKIRQMNNAFSAQLSAQMVSAQLAEAARLGQARVDRRVDAPVGARAVQRVLLVEDETVHQDVVCKQLAGQCRVDVVSSGREALRQCAQSAYDAVLLDCVLPDRDGWTLVDELRNCALGPLVILGFTNMPEQALPARIDGAIGKPFRAEVFWRQLAALGLYPASEEPQ